MGLGNILKTSLEFVGLVSSADNHFRKYRFSKGFKSLEENSKRQTSALIRNEELVKNKYSEDIYEQLLVLFKLREQLYSNLSKAGLCFEMQNYDAMNSEIEKTEEIFDEVQDGFVRLERKMRALLRERKKMPATSTYWEKDLDFETTQGSARYFIIVKGDVLSIPESIQEQNTQHGKNVAFDNKIILVRNFINNKILSDLAELKTAA